MATEAVCSSERDACPKAFALLPPRPGTPPRPTVLGQVAVLGGGGVRPSKLSSGTPPELFQHTG
eukprot:5919935-Prymnesium_polylepis.1